MFTLSKDRSKKGKELRMVVVETLQDMMKSDAQVVAMEADLGGASGFTKIQKSNPDRFIQCGISEANMTGVAAGLSVTGFKPYIFKCYCRDRNCNILAADHTDDKA